MKTMSSKAKPFAWQGFTASFGFALGDISISMIYAFKAVFISQDGKPDETIVLGALSMIFWLIIKEKADYSHYIQLFANIGNTCR